MPSSYTPNYQLSQWEASDPVQRTDFNADNAKIDAALADIVAGRTRIQWGSYTGTGEHGQEHPSTLTFPFPPKLVLICTKSTYSPQDYAFAIRGQTVFCSLYCHSSSDVCHCTWTDNSLSWYSVSNSQWQFNSGTYFYVALG